MSRGNKGNLQRESKCICVHKSKGCFVVQGTGLDSEGREAGVSGVKS